MEEQSLDEIMENSELLVSCYYIIESAVSYMASDRLLLLDQRQRGQLYTALKNGFTSILGFLQELSTTLKEQTYHLENHQKKYFVSATIRILGDREERKVGRFYVFCFLVRSLVVRGDDGNEGGGLRDPAFYPDSLKRDFRDTKVDQTVRSSRKGSHRFQ